MVYKRQIHIQLQYPDGLSAGAFGLLCWPARFLGIEGRTTIVAANSTAESYNAFQTSGSFRSSFSCQMTMRNSSAVTCKSQSFSVEDWTIAQDLIRHVQLPQE